MIIIINWYFVSYPSGKTFEVVSCSEGCDFVQYAALEKQRLNTIMFLASEVWLHLGGG
ncbi:hypothetical protein PEKONANI_01147 [Aeromonas jandaei]